VKLESTDPAASSGNRRSLSRSAMTTTDPSISFSLSVRGVVA
jgi:hypothetical protein